MLACLYHSYLGRVILKFLTWRPLSVLAGKLLDSPVSKVLIHPFIRKNSLDLSEYVVEDWDCFNAFFVRKVKKEFRPIDEDGKAFVSPCDGLLQVYPISEERIVTVKGIPYTIEDLLRSRELAEAFEGGNCLVFRLTPTHYHRYIYPDSGSKGENVFIPGVLHTVQPVAVRERPVFAENCREYTVLHTDHFGDLLFMEVGAMLVGRICNYHGKHSFVRGEEKGRFEFGGSTIIVLTRKGSVNIRQDILDATAGDLEYPVKMGQKLNA